MTSTLAIAPSLAPVQTPLLAPVLTSPTRRRYARRPSPDGYLQSSIPNFASAGPSRRRPAGAKIPAGQENSDFDPPIISDPWQKTLLFNHLDVRLVPIPHGTPRGILGVEKHLAGTQQGNFANLALLRYTRRAGGACSCPLAALPILEEVIPLDLDAKMAKPASTDARHTRLLRRLDCSREGRCPWQNRVPACPTDQARGLKVHGKTRKGSETGSSECI
jgi:hypothetical protein